MADAYGPSGGLASFEHAMPQCQRSENNTILPEGQFEIAPGVVQCPGAPYCPGCAGRELYVELPSGLLHEYLAASIDSCLHRFWARLDDEPTRLWLGAGRAPVTIHETGAGYGPHVVGYGIYLVQSGTVDQYRYQIAHEAFHRVFGASIHWTHEVLAELFSLWRLRESGHDGFAAVQRSAYVAATTTATLGDLHAMTGDWRPLAYAVGQDLLEACGWDETCRLAHHYDEAGRPDPIGWLDTLAPGVGVEVAQIMGLPVHR